MESAYPQFGGENNARRKKNQDNFWEKDQPLAGHLNFQDFTNFDLKDFTIKRIEPTFISAYMYKPLHYSS